MDYVIIPTLDNYDETNNFFNTYSVVTIIHEDCTIEPHAVMEIKLTVLVRVTEKVKKQFHTNKIIFRHNFCATEKRI